MASRPAKKKAAPRSSKGKKPSPFWSFLAYAAMALVAIGLVWVAWPILFPPHKQQPPPNTAQEVQELSAEHPDAEALNPAGSDSKKK